MVGQSQFPEKPFLDVLYEEESATLFLINDAEDNYILHAEVSGPVSHNRLRHFDDIFLSVIAGLMERELDHVIAWVPMNEGNLNFARYFGFEELPSIRIVPTADGGRQSLQEMIYIFPRLDDAENA